ncbi:MAG: hypothetical protein ABFS45_03510 [Pseudomonadota bacterium]
MVKIMMVPIHLDVLWLSQELSVLEPMVDFSRQPYQAGDHDANPNVTYLSEEILSRPFEDRGFLLKPGIHLHWALPDALTRGVSQGILFHTDPAFRPGSIGELPEGLREAFAEHDIPLSNASSAVALPRNAEEPCIIVDPDTERSYTLRQKRDRLNVYGSQITFPAVPNRWLVRRSGGNKPTAEWIVESDYLYPPGTQPPPSAVTYPVQSTANSPPFRYLGRQLVRDEGEQVAAAESPASYLKKLTAIGHGDPNFHAFYPNCHSVFGCFDPALPDGVIHYDVLGWFADPHQDCLQSPEFEDALDAILTKYNLTGVTAEARYETLAEQYGWRVTGEDGQWAEQSDWWTELKDDVPFPERTVCYARITLDSSQTSRSSLRGRERQKVRCAVGNTGTEALSAHLADGLEGDKVKIEDQLEALHLAGHFKGRHLDIGATFYRARHTKQYTAVNAGIIWSVTPAGAASGDSETPTTTPNLEPEIADLLNRLNLMQAEFDECGRGITSRRQQLFADWYKYMICAYPPEDQIGDYPDMDEVKFFIETNGLQPLGAQVAHRRTLRRQRDQLLDELSQRLAEITANPSTAGPSYILKPIPSPRYWRPNDPVILIEGVEPTPRHGEDGALKCRLKKGLPSGDISQHLDILLDAVEQCAMDKSTGLHQSSEQPWHPFLLEWRVDVLPLGSSINLDPHHPAYKTDFIERNYDFPDAGQDLTLKSGQAQVIDASNRYSGRSILLPHAKIALRTQMETYLQTQLLPGYYKDQEIPLASRTNDFFIDNYAKIFDWYDALPPDDENRGKNLTSLLNIYRHLFGNPKQPEDSPDLHCMTQTLTGFNEALLMHKQTRQLPIDDPLGFESNRAFTDAVREAVQSETRSAPQPLNDFNPLRSGVLRLADLRLVDTFGRVQVLDFNDQPVTTAEPLQTPALPHETHLPPRFAQPARLNFRWLSADRSFTEHTDQPEMNSHPASSPLCGWLLPNLLDKRLMVYAADGQPLGSISTDGQWYGAPGEPRLAPWEAPNPHLGRLLVHLLRHENLASFLDNIETHYGAIDPENFAEHAALSLLIGRPLAVARVALNLDLQGLPAVNEDWNAFRRDLQRSVQSTDGVVERREDDHFTTVKIPIKLGAFEQLNDGLVAFWEEHWAGDGVCKYRYVERDQDRKYVQYSAEAKPLLHAPDDSPLKLTMLLDPRGVVHATSGILPSKAISLPPDQYADALKRLAVTFLTAPVLTEAGKINLPLPEEPGYVWSWVDKAHGTWEDVEEIGRPNTNATWGAAQEVVEGWLKLTPNAEE